MMFSSIIWSTCSSMICFLRGETLYARDLKGMSSVKVILCFTTDVLPRILEVVRGQVEINFSNSS